MTRFGKHYVISHNNYAEFTANTVHVHVGSVTVYMYMHAHV